MQPLFVVLFSVYAAMGTGELAAYPHEFLLAGELNLLFQIVQLGPVVAYLIVQLLGVKAAAEGLA